MLRKRDPTFRHGHTPTPPDRPDPRRVGPGLPIHPGAEARRPTRQVGPAGDRRRPAVRRPRRPPMANLAARLPAPAGRVLVLPLLEEGRDARSAHGRTAGRPPGRRRRQPVGQDDGKGGARGYDDGKKVTGRKRHILVDTLGLILTVVAHPAHVRDADGLKLVFGAGSAGRGWSGSTGATSERPARPIRLEVVERAGPGFSGCPGVAGSWSGRSPGWVGIGGSRRTTRGRSAAARRSSSWR